MKKYICILAVALLTLTACSSDNGESKDDLTVQKLIGLWAADYAENKTEGDLHWTREGDFHYTISGNTVTVTIDKTGEKWTMTYADGKLSDPERIAFQKATTAQQTLVEQLYGEWQKANSGTKDDGSTVKTDVTDSYTDEPARVRRR